MSSDEGDIILDPFIGTGTTAVAAKKLGRKFIGIDIDQKYVEITNNKLELVEPTILSGCYVSIFLDNVVTIRNKDWEKIKDSFVIPEDPIRLEKQRIHFKNRHRRIVKEFVSKGVQKDLF